MTASEKLALVLDVGGTNFRVGLVDNKGCVVARDSYLTDVESGPDASRSRITEKLVGMRSNSRGREVLGLGVAIASPLDSKTGSPFNPPNLPGWNQFPLASYWGEKLRLPVSVANDGNAAALGEYFFGVGRGLSDFLYITVGTGIGGGVISGGNLITGARGFAAEIGHMSVDPNGPICQCGNIGCLEVLASGTAIGRFAQDEMFLRKASVLSQMVKGHEDSVTAVEVTEAARRGDMLSLDILRKAGLSLAQGIVSLVHIFNPQMVAVGGGVSAGWELWSDVVEGYVFKRGMLSHRDGLSIVLSSLGDNAGLVGAGVLVFSGSEMGRR